MATTPTADCGKDANDPGAHILCLLRSPFTAQIQANSIGVAFGYSMGITAFTLIFFSLIRPRHHIVYEPKIKYADKKHCPPPLGKGIFAWVKPTLTMKEDTLVEKIGLDGAIFLRFTRMLRNMFLVLSVLGCAVLIPVHVSQTPIGDQSFANKNPIASWVQQMTPQAVQPPVMWAHVVMGYVFNIIVLAFIWWNYRAVARLRKAHFISKEYQQSLHARSVWLMDLPAPLRSDEGILKIVDSIEHTTSVPRPSIARNVRELPELIEEHDKTVKKLESILAKYLKNPDKLPAQRPVLRASKKDHRADHRNKVDAIDYLTRRIKDLEIEIKDVRESIDKRNAMAYGFATWERIEEAHTVALAAGKKRRKGVMVNLSPRPNDFIWKNLSLMKSTRSRKKLVVNFWVALLTLIWVVPNAFIAVFLVNLSNLASLSPSINQSITASPQLYSVIQAILGPTLLSTFYLCLPIIFRRLSARAGDLTKTSRERHVTHKLYAFFIFNNLVVFSLFGSIWAFVVNVINFSRTQNTNAWDAIEKANFTNSLLTALCQVSVFWITWLLQRNLTAAIDISQAWQLFWVWFSKTFLAPTPRQKIVWTAPQPFDYAQYFNWFLFYATVALSNAMLQPIVLVCALIIFSIEAVLKKYLMLYVYITKTESGGLYWNVLINRLLFGLGVSHLVGALVIKGVQNAASDPWTTYIQLMCMVPLWFIILGFKYYTVKTFEPRCKYYVKALASSAEAPAPIDPNKKRRNERIHVKFGHPALYKPLITPMVASKAQHVLPSLLRGHSFDDGTGYADGVAMDQMSPNQPGMKGGDSGMDSNMFEMVSEANMDFAYYKNRAEFGEEHGGGGELYGHANDLISERSGTPASFLTQDSDDARSATGTPPPMPTYPFQQQPEHMSNHPAFRSEGRDQSPSGTYSHFRNDSQSRLLSNMRGYTPVSRDGGHDGYFASGSVPPTPSGAHGDMGSYGLERWRTGGSAYDGMHGAGGPDDAIAYDSYRSAAAAHARNTSGASHGSAPGTRSRTRSPGPNQAYGPATGLRRASPGPNRSYGAPQPQGGYNPQGYAANGGRF